LAGEVVGVPRPHPQLLCILKFGSNYGAHQSLQVASRPDGAPVCQYDAAATPHRFTVLATMRLWLFLRRLASLQKGAEEASALFLPTTAGRIDRLPRQ
jgi:hypothetical protein